MAMWVILRLYLDEEGTFDEPITFAALTSIRSVLVWFRLWSLVLTKGDRLKAFPSGASCALDFERPPSLDAAATGLTGFLVDVLETSRM